MSVWDSLVGQKPVIDMLSRIAQGDPSQITQSWLICGPPGSGRSNMARAFAAALESPDHGMSAEPTRVTQQVLAGTHPDVTVLTTNKVTIGIDQVREIITTSEQMPATAPWRIIIIEDVDRMLDRTTNVLLKEIEEPAEHCIWLLCAPSAQDVLPLVTDCFRFIRDYRGEVPGASPRDCGNYLDMNLSMANYWGRRYTALLENITPDRLTYPE